MVQSPRGGPDRRDRGGARTRPPARGRRGGSGSGAHPAPALEVGADLRTLRDAVAVCPPLIITDAQIDELFDKMGQSLDLALADARAAGLMP
jgi:hypothetical protein